MQNSAASNSVCNHTLDKANLVYHSYDYRPNQWTPLSPVTIINTVVLYTAVHICHYTTLLMAKEDFVHS